MSTTNQYWSSPAVSRKSLGDRVRSVVEHWPNACEAGRREFLDKLREAAHGNTAPPKAGELIGYFKDGELLAVGTATGADWNWQPVWAKEDSGLMRDYAWRDRNQGPKQILGRETLLLYGEDESLTEFEARIKETIEAEHPHCAVEFMTKLGYEDMVSKSVPEPGHHFTWKPKGRSRWAEQHLIAVDDLGERVKAGILPHLTAEGYMLTVLSDRPEASLDDYEFKRLNEDGTDWVEDR